MSDATLNDILAAVNGVSSKLVVIESQVNDLRDDRNDHERRLRTVEQRTDETQRINALDTRVTQHDAAFTRVGERLGSIETAVVNINETLAARPTSLSVISVIAAVAGTLAAIIAVILS